MPSLFQLRNPVIQTESIGYVSLARPENSTWRDQICKEGTVAGWGVQRKMQFRGQTHVNFNPYIQCAILKVPEQIICKLHNTPTYDGIKFCALHENATQDVCKVRNV